MKDTKDKQTIKKLKEILHSDFILIVGLCMVIGFLVIFILIYIPKHETIETIERLDVKSQNYPYNTEILCEEGVIIIPYKILNLKVIFGCLELIYEIS
jgi:hypothetical protein